MELAVWILISVCAHQLLSVKKHDERFMDKKSFIGASQISKLNDAQALCSLFFLLVCGVLIASLGILPVSFVDVILCGVTQKKNRILLCLCQVYGVGSNIFMNSDVLLFELPRVLYEILLC